MIRKLDRPDGFGVILRTAAIGQTKASIEQDIKRSLRLWKKLEQEMIEERCELPVVSGTVDARIVAPP